MEVKQNQTSNGDMIATLYTKLINRTSGTLTNGDVVTVNANFAATAGETMAGLNPGDDTDGAAGFYLGAAVNPSTERNLRACFVVDDPRAANGVTIADNDEVRVCVKGRTRINIATGANAVVGVHLAATNASKLATGILDQAALDALAVPTKIFGWLEEANASAGNAVRRCVWDGFGMFVAGGGA